MEARIRIEQTLQRNLDRASCKAGPDKLGAALGYAVFPGGARIRPRLCLAVAAACGDDRPGISNASAAAIEFLHCASLVHDDLPCFDDAPTRRGKKSVHCEFGEPLAVLAGDALIVLAFETIAQAGAIEPARAVTLSSIISAFVGMPRGIVAGQAWECEPEIDTAAYQRAKTGALFAAATCSGAAAAGFDPSPWRALGEGLGEAYQVADDIRDTVSSAEELGKPVGQDEAHGRPNVVLQKGLDGAVGHLKDLVGATLDSIPPCPGSDALRDLIILETKRFLPKSLSRHAA